MSTLALILIGLLVASLVIPWVKQARRNELDDFFE